MNTLDLNNKRDFPLTTNALKFLQDACGAFEQLAKLGGDNYILSGCEVTGTSAANGWVVIGGKLMPFVGNTIQTNVKVVTTTTNVVVGSGNRDETVLHAEFGTSANPAENIVWATLNANRISPLLGIASTLASLDSIVNGVKTTVVEIGPWDMDVTSAHNVLLPASIGSISKVVSFDVVIIDDLLAYLDSGLTRELAGVSSLTAFITQFTLGGDIWLQMWREAGGYYDSTNYNSTLINRGFIHIRHKL